MKQNKKIDYWSLSLSEGLEIVHVMFKHHSPKELHSHSFDIYCHCGLWGFKVIDSWHKWSNKNLTDDFGLYKLPEYAVAAFLDYVEKNKINVKKLCE